MCTISVTRLVTVKKKRKFFFTYLGGIVPWVTTKIPLPRRLPISEAPINTVRLASGLV